MTKRGFDFNKTLGRSTRTNLILNPQQPNQRCQQHQAKPAKCQLGHQRPLLCAGKQANQERCQPQYQSNLEHVTKNYSLQRSRKNFGNGLLLMW